MKQEQLQELLRSQQGELNAVLMYQRLAKVVKTEKERDAFLQLAKEEGRHASVFHAYTKEALKPKKTMAVIMPLLYRILGGKRLYKLTKVSHLPFYRLSRIIKHCNILIDNLLTSRK